MFVNNQSDISFFAYLGVAQIIFFNLLFMEWKIVGPR